MLPSRPTFSSTLLFSTALLAVVLFFGWSRYDHSTRIYFFGDGNLAVAMVQLMRDSGNWDPNWHRLDLDSHVPEKLKPFYPPTGSDAHAYNMSGYFVLATAFSKIMSPMGNVPIPVLLRCLNVLLQAATLCLLFLIGQQLKDRWLGLLAVASYSVFPLAVLEAHYERTESLLTLLATLMLFASLRLAQSPWRWSVVAGLALGLSIASKISQLYLALLPAIALLSLLWQAPATGRRQALLKVLAGASGVFLAAAAAVYLTVPFMVEHPLLYLQEVKNLIAIQVQPDPPYILEHYSPLAQLAITWKYFSDTLGIIWLCFWLLGLVILFRAPWLSLNLAQRLCIVFPCVFIPVYFSQFHSFFERNFSAIIGFICLCSAVGIYLLVKKISTWIARPAFAAVCVVLLLTLTLYPALALDRLLVQRFFHGNDHQQRLAFQMELKADFPGFWIKNIEERSARFLLLPELEDKKPRIYVVKDFNHPASDRYINLLSRSGFERVGEYRSLFYGMVPNNITIYHDAHAYHYLVRKQEWPQDLRRDYFKQN